MAASGLTFKASNAAFQAAPAGEEHGLQREVIEAKMPRQAGNSQQQGPLPISGTHQPILACLVTRLSFLRVPRKPC